MKRVAFKMKLYEGYAEEYKKRHDELWPEMKELLAKAGISDYSIFLDEETMTLFGVHKLSDDNTADEVRDHPVNRKWWDFMADIMETNSDKSPVQIPLREVFHLD